MASPRTLYLHLEPALHTRVRMAAAKSARTVMSYCAHALREGVLRPEGLGGELVVERRSIQQEVPLSEELIAALTTLGAGARPVLSAHDIAYRILLRDVPVFIQAGEQIGWVRDGG